MQVYKEPWAINPQKKNRQFSCMTIWQFSYMTIHLERHLDNEASQYREIVKWPNIPDIVICMYNISTCTYGNDEIYYGFWTYWISIQIGEQVYKMTTSCILYIYFCLKTMKMGTWYKMAMET